MDKTAMLMKSNLPGFHGQASLYHLSPPIESYEDGNGEKSKYEYVIVSATIASFTGAETYIFPANILGEIEDWEELPGSYRGGLDHAMALAQAGYRIVEATEVKK